MTLQPTIVMNPTNPPTGFRNPGRRGLLLFGAVPLFAAMMSFVLLSSRPASATLLQTFNDPTVTSSDEFGRSVALSGNNVLIGANSDDTAGSNVGQAHLFSIAIPEPSAFALAALGLLSLGFVGWRRRKRG